MPRRRVVIATGAGEKRTTGGEKRPRKHRRAAAEVVTQASRDITRSAEKAKGRVERNVIAPVLVQAEREAEQKRRRADQKTLADYREKRREARRLGLPDPPRPELAGGRDARRREAARILADIARRYPEKPGRLDRLFSKLPEPTKRELRAVGHGISHFSERGVSGELKAAGIIDEEPGFAKYGRRFTRDLGEAAIYTPVGLVAAGKAGGGDIADTVRGKPTGKRSAEFAKEVGVATAKSVTPKEIKEHPGYAFLTALAAVSAGAGTVSRASAAGSALRAGEGLGSAVARPGYKGGSLLHRPTPGTTTLTTGHKIAMGQRYGGKTVHRLEPDAPYLRPLHRRRARKLQAQLDNPQPPSKYRGVRMLQKKFGAENTVRRALAAEHRTHFNVDQAAVEAARVLGRKLSRAEKAALRVVQIEGYEAIRHPEDTIGRHIQTHLRYADEGYDPALNREIAKDLQAALPVLRKRDSKFKEALRATQAMSRKSQQQLIAEGILAPEHAAERQAAHAAEYGRGSLYVPRSEKPAAIRQVTRSQRALETYAEQEKRKIKRAARPLLTPRLEKARAAEAEANRAAQVAAAERAKLLTRYQSAKRRVERAESALLNAQTRPRGKAADTARRARELAAARAEMAQLRDALDRQRRAAPVQTQRKAQLAREAAEQQAHDLQQQALRKHEERLTRVTSYRKQLAERRARIEAPGEAPPGSFYGPTGDKFKLRRGTGPSTPVTRRPGPQGLGPVQSSRYLGGTTKRFTGRGLRHGVVEEPLEAIAERATGTNRLAQAQRLHGDLKKMAHGAEQRTEWDVPIRDTAHLPEHTQRQLAVEFEKLQGGDESALARALDLLKPAEGDSQLYVDARLIPEFVAGSPSQLIKDAASFNKPFRISGVFARPAYIATNRPQNFIMRKLAQGIPTRKQMRGSVRDIRRELGPQDSALVDALGGEARTESYMPHVSRVSRAERALVRKVTELTDRDERFLAVLGRAYDAGYTDMKGLRRFLHDPKAGRDRLAVGQRADKDMVQFSNLTPREAQIAQFVYFYPWLSRGSMWAGRFVVEHPIKSALLAELARRGKEDTPEWLKNAPSWTQGYISSRFGLSNPAPLNTFATPAEIGRSLTGDSAFSEEFGAPVVTAATTKPSELPGELFGRGTAPGRMLRGFGVYGPLTGKPPKAFPETGVGPAFGPFLIGGPFARQPDKAYLQEAGAKERVDRLSPTERVKTRYQGYRSQTLELVKRAGLAPRDAKALSPEMARAFDRRESRFRFRAERKAKTLREGYEADVLWLASQGVGTKADAEREAKWARSQTRDSQIRRRRADIIDPIMDDLYLDAFADLREILDERGYDLPTMH